MRAIHLLMTLLLLAVPLMLWPAQPPFVGPPAPAPTCYWVQDADGVRCAAQKSPTPKATVTAPARMAALGLPVDVNRGTVEELASLDGIGPKLAARIVAARPFATVDDVARVRGIGARRLARLRPRLKLDD
jgi:competence ComEA-like helix-hairpin-helix protein